MQVYLFGVNEPYTLLILVLNHNGLDLDVNKNLNMIFSAHDVLVQKIKECLVEMKKTSDIHDCEIPKYVFLTCKNMSEENGCFSKGKRVRRRTVDRYYANEIDMIQDDNQTDNQNVFSLVID